jgi:cysteinyl-tRNA synthetase
MYYFYTTIRAMREFIANNKNSEVTAVRQDDISETIIPEFIKHMDDDFNTAVALANLHGIFKYVNNVMKQTKQKEETANTLERILKNIQEVYGVLGLFKQEPSTFTAELKKKYLAKLEIEETYIEEQINKRAEAKKNRDFEQADKIRSELDEKGIILMDRKRRNNMECKGFV